MVTELHRSCEEVNVTMRCTEGGGLTAAVVEDVQLSVFL